MGFTPMQVGQMSLFQFACAIDGWNAAHGGEDQAAAPSEQEFEEAKRSHGD